MEPKIESSVKYDDRRKELTHKTKEERKTEFGQIKIESEGVYDEAGIRKILSELESKKEVLKKNVTTLKELKETPNISGKEEELEKLKENLKLLQLIDHKEKASEPDLKKETEDLKKNEEELKKVNKDIKDIKEAIGSRLQL